MKQMFVPMFLIGSLGLPLAAHDMGQAHNEAKEALSSDAGMKTYKGEIVDMVCYLDHGAKGAKHTDCAKTCITSGLPVGLKADDGQLYLLVGEHKSMNNELAPYAGKTVTVKGKLASRDGVKMIENTEIVR